MQTQPNGADGDLNRRAIVDELGKVLDAIGEVTATVEVLLTQEPRPSALREYERIAEAADAAIASLETCVAVAAVSNTFPEEWATDAPDA